MRCIDLFSGAGGLTEGFIQAGYNILAHVEKEYPASLTLKTRLAYHYLKKNNKINMYISYLKKEITRDELYLEIPSKILDSVINEEINDETINDIFYRLDKLVGNEKVDIVIGGPPCQAYSLVGRARDPKGMKEDQRNYLYKQYLKFIARYKPGIFVFENVRGILTAQNKKLFPQILSEMKELGYQVEHKILNAKDFGVPQSRERLIIIGKKEGINLPYPEFEKEKNNITVNDLFQDLPKMKPGDIIDYKEILRRENIKSLMELGLIEDNWNILTQHVTRNNLERDLKIYKIAASKMLKNERIKYTDLPNNLKTHKNEKAFLDRFKVVDGNGICHTMVAHISKDGHHYIHPDVKQNRSITVREAARIQTFPDDYYFENCRTAAFTQIGNAVPPLMAKKIALKIKETISK